MTQILANQLESANLDCFRAWAYDSQFFRTVDDGRLFQIITPTRTKWLNGVRWSALDDAQGVPDVVQSFRTSSTPATWRVSPASSSIESTRKILESLGCAYLLNHIGVVVEIGALASRPKSDLVVQQVTTPELAAAWTIPFLEAFEMPQDHQFWSDIMCRSVGRSSPFQHFVGFQGGRPVACGSVYVQGEMAYICNGGVLVDARGRGYSSEMIRFRGGYARVQGCKYLGSFASPEGFPVQGKLGFREVSRAHWYEM